jgi:hypothetical protein
MGGCSTPFLEIPMTRTFGAAIGALLFVFFMSYIATRLVHPVSASSSQRVASAPHTR